MTAYPTGLAALAAFVVTMEERVSVVCAWCKRAKLSDGTWSPDWPEDLYPAMIENRASHGCCPECEAEQVAALSQSPALRHSSRPGAYLSGGSHA